MRVWWVWGLGLLVWGCQGTSPPPQAQEKVILTTFTVLADMTRNVAGEQVRVESITKPGAEIHGYEPTPMDIARAQNASLILENGLGLERWAERFYSNLRDVPQGDGEPGDYADSHPFRCVSNPTQSPRLDVPQIGTHLCGKYPPSLW
jgi:ABC-type Zn uptake system ZnuABC Zn-binding protein ZnuA